jgi:hypothetical protein
MATFDSPNSFMIVGAATPSTARSMYMKNATANVRPSTM